MQYTESKRFGTLVEDLDPKGGFIWNQNLFMVRLDFIKIKTHLDDMH